MSDIEFAYPWVFLALLIVPLLIVRYIFQIRKNHSSLLFGSTSGLENLASNRKLYLKHFFFALRMLGLIGIIVAMARPQSSSSSQSITSEGIDIIVSLDISSSMLAKDFDPNRLEASKQVALEFIDGRPQDRIGLVVYSGESFTQCPLTTDHSVLKNLFENVRNGMIEDGTAIGSGLSTAVSRLKNSDAKSKVVILLTDGSNNSGEVPPITAAQIAKTFGVRVYTIGVGTNGEALSPVQAFQGQYIYRTVPVKIDEVTLKEIAEITEGQYFRATDNQKLREIYKEIDQLEKSKVEVTEFRKKTEEHRPILYASFVLIMLTFLLDTSLLKSII